MGGDPRHLLFFLLALLAGCFPPLRAPEGMGPGLLDATSMAMGDGEMTLSTGPGTTVDPGGGWGPHLWTTAIGELDVGLGRSVSFVSGVELRGGTGEHTGLLRGRAGLRFRFAEHVWISVGVTPMRGFALMHSYLAADVQIGGSAWLGPLLVSGGVGFSTSTSLPLYGPTAFWYAQPTFGLALRVDPRSPVRPMIQARAQIGASYLDFGWKSVGVDVVFGLQARVPAPD